MQSRELFHQLIKNLVLPVGEGEKQAIVRWLLEARLGIGAADVMGGKEVGISPEHFEEDLKRLNQGEPLQYVLGYTEFLGRKFTVNPAVLIPRPETELLVRFVRETLHREAGGAIVDIGTGSGCIAVSLALEFPKATVHATDVDASALTVAKENTRSLGAPVQFHLHNILHEPLPFESLATVVSNPPYIRKREAAAMNRNVLDFEPHHALFVPDENPLVFHRAIARKAYVSLRPGGLLAMEINEAFGSETRDEVALAGFSSIVIHQDIDGKDRFVTAVRNP